MAVLKCKMCGGTLEFGGESVAVCEYCGTKQTLPQTRDEALTNLYNRANNLRRKCEFDRALSVYEKIVEQDNEQAEAHWGIVLCKYGIEYVEDPRTGSRVPTCHRTLFEAITADADYEAAIDYADVVQQELYKSEARAIDRIQKDILAIVHNEKPFDVFLCYKETDFDGKRTQDSVIANDIYYQLTQEGFKVFYAAVTLEDKLGQEYEPYIFAALHSARVMLVIGTKPEFFDAVWVRNEWSRFLHLAKDDRKKLLIPCYRDMDAYDLPNEFAHLQAQDMSKIGFINDVARGIKRVLGKDEPKPTAAEPTLTAAPVASVETLLKRAFLFLEDGEWGRANEFCEQVLNLDPENARAYLGLLMADLKVHKPEDLKNCAESFDANSNYQKATRFADDKLNAALTDYVEHIKIRNETAKKDKILSTAKLDLRFAERMDYERAIQALKQIPGWKDADKLADVYREKIKEITEQEQRRCAERRYQAEQQRIAVEKRNTIIRKIIAIATPIICAVIAFVIILDTILIPDYKYNKAIAYMDSGNMMDAYNILITLDDYKNSTEKADSILNNYRTDMLKSAEVGDYVFFGSFEQDGNAYNGAEDIEWLVLSKKDGKALVISKYALHCKPYGNSSWETTSLCQWLNKGFLFTAFSADEISMIATVTQDHVFALSVAEVDTYFDSDNARQCRATEYAVANGAVNGSNGNCWWWLQNGAYVDSNGHIYDEAYSGIYGHGAVRPAMWIDLNA